MMLSDESLLAFLLSRPSVAAVIFANGEARTGKVFDNVRAAAEAWAKFEHWKPHVPEKRP